MRLTSLILVATLALGGPAYAQGRDKATPEAGGVPDAGGRCARILQNNDILVPDPHVVDNVSHTLRIRNGGDSPALVKVTEVERNERVLFYVATGRTATILLNDGSYIIRYALGGHLAADCETVIRPAFVGRFPGVQQLITERDADSWSTAELEYTLFTVQDGNVKPKAIPPSEFNRD